jgi:AraC-like DNA-binding protein
MPSSRTVDVLTDMLERSRARGAAFSHSTLHGRWGLAFDGVPGLAVHAIVEGEINLLAGGETLRLLPGDIVLVRGGLDHRLASSPEAHCLPLAQFLEEAQVQGSPRRFFSGDTGDPAVFFCGAYLFEGDICDRLLRLLPDTVRLRPAAGSALRTTMDLLAREMLRDDPGQQTLLDRLLDVALVQVLREHFAAQGEHAPAWFRASGDPRIGPVLRAVHADPGRRWTVEELAAEATLSRAAFARRFTAQLGIAPLTYLTGWRMALACERLRDSDDSIAAVAETLGYASEFSFAAAFKRHHGVAPGRWRLTARASASSRRTPLPADRPALRF